MPYGIATTPAAVLPPNVPLTPCSVAANSTPLPPTPHSPLVPVPLGEWEGVAVPLADRLGDGRTERVPLGSALHEGVAPTLSVALRVLLRVACSEGEDVGGA